MYNSVLLKGNETAIAQEMIPYIEGALCDTLMEQYSISKTELAAALLSIALSEGSRSSSKGAIVFQSSLVLKGNNPFGIKGKGIKTPTFEYINGQKTLINSSFRYFDSFSASVWYISHHIGEHKRYANARIAITGEAFLRELHKAGYATSPDWFERFTIPKYKLIHSNYDYTVKSIYWYRGDR